MYSIICFLGSLWIIVAVCQNVLTLQFNNLFVLLKFPKAVQQQLDKNDCPCCRSNTLWSLVSLFIGIHIDLTGKAYVIIKGVLKKIIVDSKSLPTWNKSIALGLNKFIFFTKHCLMGQEIIFHLIIFTNMLCFTQYMLCEALSHNMYF